uniref:hypothetical protein n=1 Tax=Caballeronia sp. BR00000012568055 TaxID=2918761 RepID=UPI0023FA0AF3
MLDAIFFVGKRTVRLALMYSFLQKTIGWFLPAGERLQNNNSAIFRRGLRVKTEPLSFIDLARLGRT